MTLQLGISLAGAQHAQGWQRALKLVRRADALQLHSVWLPENHFNPNATAAPLTALAAFAAVSTRLRLATTSLLLPVHHPLRVAADTAALDALSGGRLLLGLGRGFTRPLFAGFGVAAAAKRGRFDAALDSVLALWEGRAIGGARLPHRPLQRPHPPLVVAAFGPLGLTQAARRGLPYLASPLETLPALMENYAAWRAQLRAEVSAAAPQRPVMRTVYCAETQAEARAVLAALSAEGLHARRMRPATKALARAAAGALHERVLVGGAAEVQDAIGEYRRRLKMDLLVARVEVPGAPEAARDEALERLAREVLPGL